VVILNGFHEIIPAKHVISPSSAAISELLPEPGEPTTTVSRPVKQTKDIKLTKNQ